MDDQAQTILEEVFGFSQFRPLQAEIIDNVLKKNDTLVIMPTGGGKSLCYQIPALIFDSLTVVVSPLISLMKDQVEQLTQYGVEAVVLNSSLSAAEYSRNVQSIRRNEVRLLYVAPETLLKPNILALLEDVGIDCLTIDEAHCISEWGHDFRPEYRQLVGVRARFPDAVCIALTATATPRVQQDITSTLRFDASNEFVASFNRENLFIQVVSKSDALAQTVDFLHKFPDQSGIIYCFSRRQVDELYAALERDGFSVKPYHAGLDELDRKRHQEAFIRDDVQIIVATIAFGMGINKPNVRFVVHYDLPKNIESYYQEIGRAGRDGLRAECLLLFSYADIQKIRYFINQKGEHERHVASVHLNALLQFAETHTCRREPLLTYFGEDYAVDNCGMCDNCLGTERELVDLTIAAQKFLSCVKRTDEIFGAGHVTDVLRGSRSQKVLKFGHQELSTYGIGKEHSKKQWFRLARQFVQQGLLTQDTKFGSLKLTVKAYDVFKGNLAVMGTLEQEQAETGRGVASIPEHDGALFEILRARRKELADKANVPPYAIFPDKTLIEMAAFFPQSSQSLLKVHGVGAVKLERYGSIFLKLIGQYCDENQIEERDGLQGRKSGSSSSSSQMRHVVVGEAFNAGKSVKEIMETFAVKQGTVLNHLAKYLMDGQTIRSGELQSLSALPVEQQNSVLDAFGRLGAEFLRPVFEEFGGKIGYDELKILRLVYLSEKIV